MVSPCIDNRINSRSTGIQFSNATQYMLGNGSVEDSAPPIEYQFSSGNAKVCSQPKHSSQYRRTKNAPHKRKLGNVRALLFNSGAEELRLNRKIPTKSTSSDDSKASTYSRKNNRKTKSLTTKFKRVNANENKNISSSSSDSHFSTKSDYQRRRQMAATLNAMLSGMNRRKNSLKIATREFHEQQAPDARKDPYNVHKWRQKSSRKKYAGMQASPIFQKHMQENTEEHENVSSDKIARSHFKKPGVPLPGVNMLPALPMHDRSHVGSTGQNEVTFTFARNAAMEEMERRFHDDSWKTKRIRKIKTKKDNSAGLEHETLDDLLRETRRTNVLRRVASLRHAHHETQDVHKISAMQTLASLSESNNKSASAFNLHPIDSQRLPLTEAQNKPLHLISQHKNDDEEQISLVTPNTDAINYKMMAESFSEETVTIVSKPSEMTSPTKNMSPMLSKSFSSRHSLKAEQRNQNSQHLPVAGPKNRTSIRRYPVLPDFPKSEKSKYEKGNAVFNQLQQSMSSENEHQYQKYSRSLKSLKHATNAREKKLPPLLTSNQTGSKTSETKSTHKKVRVVDEGHLGEIIDGVSPLGKSPTTRRKKPNSSKTSPLSHASEATLHAKDSSSTPVDSISSFSTGGGRRKSNRWRRRSTRGENKGSPQFYKSQKQTKMAKLMAKWRAAIRLSIMFGRLCAHHHIVTDDSYNIKFGRSQDERSGTEVKPEVLFDVTDYKMKNQQKLSDTTRRILSTPSDERTDQDIRMVQTALRNVKAISDHSASVQSNIARSGYFVGFGSKKVVVLENRRSLNYYVLLAGSAVVIKKDEKGNTNPAWFMKRGDVFGEREILENGCWEWSVVTVDPCEFLLLDKKEYMRIFLAGGSGGLLNDPDRGTFLKKLSLFQGWPTQLLESNPNRCLFRYYKRGALIVRNNAHSDWIFVVKSGSCSVLKPLKVEEFTPEQVFYKLLQEQKVTFPPHLMKELVQRQESINKEDHLQKIQEIANTLKADQMSVASSYKKIEMASLLKELNLDTKENVLTPVDEEDENEYEKEESYNKNKVSINITEGDIEPYIPNTKPDSEFRMSRVSDRTTQPRTPSPMKAAYLQTGISSPEKGSRHENSVIRNENADFGKNQTLDLGPKIENDHIDDTQQTIQTDAVSAEDFLSKLDSSSDSENSRPTSATQNLKPVYVNIRKLTKGSSFGLGPVLFNEQPNLSLISNGAECLVLHKKFYLDNMTDDVLKHLREYEHPYPSESELYESYWRLISWKAFQQRTVQGFLRQQTKVRQYLNPPKTDVY